MSLIIAVSLWQSPILVIIAYGSSVGWYVWTWIPLSGYVGGSLFLAYLFNKARKAQRNEAYDDKRWPTEAERLQLMERLFKGVND